METFGGQIIYNGHSEAFKNIELCDRMWGKEYHHQFFFQVFCQSDLLAIQSRVNMALSQILFQNWEISWVFCLSPANCLASSLD